MRTDSSWHRLHHFFSAGIWHNRPDTRPLPWFGIRLLRAILLAIRGFKANHGPLRASALTFYTLLSLVPLAAMAFGIAKGFGFERLLERELLENFSAQQEVVHQVITFARNLLNNTKGGLIAGVGVIALFWSVIKVMGNIEDSFNHIWGVSSRPLLRKLSDYLTLMIIGPVLYIMSGSISVFISKQMHLISTKFGMVHMLDPAVGLGLQCLPFVLIWCLFTMVYLIMPNTRVSFSGALLAAILAGSAHQGLQQAYIMFQINVSSYNAIYGSFAALPLFLIWMQLSWYVVLFGAEIARGFEQSGDADLTEGGQKISAAQLRLTAVALCTRIVRIFQTGDAPRTSRELALDLGLPQALITHVADLGVRSGLLNRVVSDDRDTPLQPAKDMGTMPLSAVFAALDNVDSNAALHFDNATLQHVQQHLHAARDQFENSAANIPLGELSRPETI